jgi:ABC-type sugar transport system ATPase subunit
MTTPPRPAIQITGLSKCYGSVCALDGIDLTVPTGEFFGLLGPNGAGKSTLIGILTGLVSPGGGTAAVFGQDVVKEYRKTRRLIGLAPQELNFDRFFTILDLLIYQGGYFGIPKDRARVRGEELLRRFGLWANVWDHVAVFLNYVITPLVFLGGVFYSLDMLPPAWRYLNLLNPVFHMVNGFRYATIGVHDVAPLA